MLPCGATNIGIVATCSNHELKTAAPHGTSSHHTSHLCTKCIGRLSYPERPHWNHTFGRSQDRTIPALRTLWKSEIWINLEDWQIYIYIMYIYRGKNISMNVGVVQWSLGRWLTKFDINWLKISAQFSTTLAHHPPLVPPSLCCYARHLPQPDGGPQKTGTRTSII